LAVDDVRRWRVIEGEGRLKKEKGKKSENVGVGLSEKEEGGIQTNKKKISTVKTLCHLPLSLGCCIR